jgi:protease II
VLSIGLVERMTAGHFGAPGRFKALEEVATFQAFALDVTGKR